MVRTARSAALLVAASALAVRAAAGPAQDYMLYCMGCHGIDAQGVPGKVPPLAVTLARFMRVSEGRDYVLRVPGAANSALPDKELTAVLNWLAERYGAPEEPRPAPFTTEEVTRARRSPLADVQATRRAVLAKLGDAAPASDY
jgi:hypothetical protein